MYAHARSPLCKTLKREIGVTISLHANDTIYSAHKWKSLNLLFTLYECMNSNAIEGVSLHKFAKNVKFEKKRTTVVLLPLISLDIIVFNKSQ